MYINHTDLDARLQTRVYKARMTSTKSQPASLDLFKLAAQLVAEMRDEFLTPWHWFGYHAARMTPFMMCVGRACVALERFGPAAPKRMLSELANIGGREKNEQDYEKLLQKLAEILVMQQVALMHWPDGTVFRIEEAGHKGAKRIDITVSQPDGLKIGFEVKAPDYLKHARKRGDGDILVPSRLVDGAIERLQNIAPNIVLPRDNTLRDFLRSANDKFASFRASGNFLGLLVVVWDDFIYEAISPLVDERQGLLTNKSYSLDAAGKPELFQNVDGVILLRHLQYFVSASREEGLPDRRSHAMHLGGDGALANVVVPIPGGRPIPQFIVDGLGAVSLGDPILENVADYRPKDFVFQLKY